MRKKPRIVMVGGGSVNWSPDLINDLLMTPGLEEAQFIILDIDEKAAFKMVQFARKLNERRGTDCTFEFSNNQTEAFTGADFILITISTGGLDAMKHDLEIPEDYRIFQTVGDTVGPGGWARGLRNIPVFAEMAKNIEKYSPNAVVLNYTNPMAPLTNVFYKTTRLKTVGLCHGLFEVYEVLMKIFKLDSEEDIKARFGGTNHFFWIIDMKIKGEDGFALLREKMNGRLFAELIKDTCTDAVGFQSGKWLSSELFDYFGYLPYMADRHICEFIPGFLAVDERKLKKYHIKRTSIKDRREKLLNGRKRLDAIISGELKLRDKRSRETAADIISALVKGKDFIDVVNLPNTGQITNLPAGSIVETLGVVNDLGFTPLNAGDLPEPVLNLVLPHVRNQNIIVEAGLEGNLEKALWALYNDPMCSHLTMPEIKEMGMKLLKANKQYLPMFEI